jgi:hypothetical protein
MRKMILLATFVALLALTMVAAPAFADVRFDRHHFFNPFFNNNGISQSNEQDVQSGDATQNIGVTGGGANSNQCAGVQGITNTGNAINNTSVLQADTPFNNGFFDGHRFDNRFFNDRFDHRRLFFDPFFFDGNGFNNGGNVEVNDTGNLTINPSQTVSCDQQVNQAASASGF